MNKSNIDEKIKSKKMAESNLKVLRVQDGSHLIAKVNATKKTLKLQEYVENLIAADEQGLIDWSKFKTVKK